MKKTKKRQIMTESERIKYNDNLAIGVNAINRSRFACGQWTRLYPIGRARRYIREIAKDKKISLLDASEIFKENAKMGGF